MALESIYNSTDEYFIMEEEKDSMSRTPTKGIFKCSAKRRNLCLLVILCTLTTLSCITSATTAGLYFRNKNLETRSTVANGEASLSSSLEASAARDLVMMSDPSVIGDPRRPAYAHKVLHMDFTNTGAQPNRETSHHLSIDPNHNYRTFEVSHGVTLIPSGIMVQNRGTYFVYKSIYFTPYSREVCGHVESQKFVSNLMLNSSLNSGDVTSLLKSVHTCCPTCQDSRETAFAGGVFYLQKNDILQVEVKGYGFVDVEKDVTFVGLIKLGSLR